MTSVVPKSEKSWPDELFYSKCELPHTAADAASLHYAIGRRGIGTVSVGDIFCLWCPAVAVSDWPHGDDHAGLRRVQDGISRQHESWPGDDHSTLYRLCELRCGL